MRTRHRTFKAILTVLLAVASAGVLFVGCAPVPGREVLGARTDIHASANSGNAAVLSRGAIPEASQKKLRTLAVLPGVNVNLKFTSAEAERPELLLGSAELTRRISALQKSLHQRPEDASGYLDLSAYLQATGRRPEAEKAVTQSVKLFRARAAARPQDGWLQAQFAGALREHGEEGEAERVLRATVLVTNDWRCCVELGDLLGGKALRFLYGVTNNWAGGSLEELLQSPLSSHPAPAQLDQAKACAAEADQCFERAVALGPTNAGPVLARALHRATQQYYFAYVLRHLGQSASGSESAKSQMSDLLGSTEFCALWSEVAHLWPTNYAAVGFWAWAEAVPTLLDSRGGKPFDAMPESRQQHFLEALRMLNKLANSPDPSQSSGAFEALGTLRLMVTSESAEARSAFRQAVTLEPSRNQAWEGLCAIAVMDKDSQALVSLCEERLKHDDTVRNHVMAAKACAYAHLPEKARAHARAAVALDATDPLGHICLGALLLGESREAKSLTEANQQFAKATVLLKTMKDEAGRDELAVICGINTTILLALDGENELARQKLRQVAASKAADDSAQERIRNIEQILWPAEAVTPAISWHSQEPDSIWMEAEINGKLARLLFDSGAGAALLLNPQGAERLGLKYTLPPADFVPPRGEVALGETEECTVRFAGTTTKIAIPVAKVPSQVGEYADGAFGWRLFRNIVFQIDGDGHELKPVDDLSAKTAGWVEFALRTNSSVLELELPNGSGPKDVVLVDTGDARGVALCPEDWRAWVAAHTNQPRTLRINIAAAYGLTTSEEAWAGTLALGPLSLTEVPICEMGTNQTGCCAVLGLAALKRTDLIVDGPHGLAYAQPKHTPPAPYNHNRLGAVFVPQSAAQAEGVARVVKGSPADKAGLRDGDVLMDADVLGMTNLQATSSSGGFSLPAGTRLKLKVKRGTQLVEVNPILQDILLPEAGAQALAAPSPVRRFGVYSVEGKAALLGADCAILFCGGESGLLAPEQLESGVMRSAVLARSLGLTNEPPEFRNVFQDAKQFEALIQQVFPLVLGREEGAKTRDAFLFSLNCMSAHMWTVALQAAQGTLLEDRMRELAGRSLAGAGEVAEKYSPDFGVECDKLWFETRNGPFDTTNQASAFVDGVQQFDTSVLLKFIARDEAEVASTPRTGKPRSEDNALGSASVSSGYSEMAELLVRATNGDASAQCDLGKMYISGQGAPRDAAEGVRWLRQAASQQDVEAQIAIGLTYYEGRGVLKDTAETAKWFRTAALKGSAEAQYLLGVLYCTGDGVPEDAAEGAKWVRQAADQGFVKAQLALAQMYLDGQGVPKDSAETMRWCRKAAEQGSVAAQAALAQAYSSGERVAKDPVEALKWMRLAAEQGDAPCQLVLGLAYAEGDGVPKDSAEAVKWWRKAAYQDNTAAQSMLGVAFYDGRGVAADAARAANWWRQAANQGNAKAQYGLGMLCFTSEGMPTNDIEAYKWVALSIAHDQPDPLGLLPALEKRMTSDQIAEAKRLAREFRPRSNSK